MNRGSWMVPDGFKMGIAVDFETCNDNALGFVFDGVQTTPFDRESIDILQLTVWVCFLYLPVRFTHVSVS